MLLVGELEANRINLANKVDIVVGSIHVFGLEFVDGNQVRLSKASFDIESMIKPLANHGRDTKVPVARNNSCW